MASFYSKTTGGLYQSSAYDSTAPTIGVVPTDSIEITDETYSSLIAQLNSSTMIQPDANGQPQIVAAPEIPLTCTPGQFKFALIEQGLYQQVVSAVNSSTDPKVQVAWTDAQIFRENDSFVTTMATAIGKTSSDIHAIFQLAQSIQI